MALKFEKNTTELVDDKIASSNRFYNIGMTWRMYVGIIRESSIFSQITSKASST